MTLTKFPMLIKLEVIKQVEIEAETYEQAVIQTYRILDSDSQIIERTFDYYMDDYAISRDLSK